MHINNHLVIIWSIFTPKKKSDGILNFIDYTQQFGENWGHLKVRLSIHKYDISFHLFKIYLVSQDNALKCLLNLFLNV